jgi:hypothetical protein
VLLFPSASTSVTGAFAIGAPRAAVPDTVLAEDAVIVKVTPLLACPPTETTTLPVVAPMGTLTVMLLALQVLAVPAETPLNVTVLLPWLAPKLDPAIVTELPIAPEVGFRLAIAGAGIVTVKLTELLACPPTVTTTPPVVAPLGTLMVILVPLQALAVPAETPLNVTVLLPWLLPKFEPVIVTGVPTGPDVVDRLVIAGAAVAPLPPPPHPTSRTPAVITMAGSSETAREAQRNAIQVMEPPGNSVVSPQAKLRPHQGRQAMQKRVR